MYYINNHFSAKLDLIRPAKWLTTKEKSHPVKDGFFIIRHRAIFPRFETQVL